MNKIEIKIAKKAGFCFGVKRALSLVEEILETAEKPVYCWGDLIHNPVIMKYLKRKGLKVIKDLKFFEEEAFFIVRSHGITLEDLELIKKRTSNIIDTTCPFVQKAQKGAENFKKKKLKVLIVGNKDHVEVKGINSRTGKQAFIVNDLKELAEIEKELPKKLGVVCQTTQKESRLMEIIKRLKELKIELVLQNTICLDASQKQKEISELKEKPDLLIVIGGFNSSNTTKLAEIGMAKKIKTYHIEKAEDLSEKWFKDGMKVVLTAGASTPYDELLKAENFIKKLY